MTTSFLIQLAMASLMVGLTVIVHYAGLSLLLMLIQQRRRGAGRKVMFVENGAVMVAAALGLFALHGIEIWAYALLYWSLGILSSFEQALYFSTSTYATIGYGDVVLPIGRRLLGAIEGVNGVLLLGWSTAFFFSVVHRMTSIEHDVAQNAKRSRIASSSTGSP